MAVSVSRFRKAFPEFDRTADELCSQKLAAAELRIASATWGDQTDQGIMWLAAHLLSMAPEGEQARINPQTQESTYMREWMRMKREVTMGVGRVI